MAAQRTFRLTELAAERARPVRGRRQELFDGPGGVPGLALRITERGVKSWSLMYRVNGKQRRLTLGRYPDVGLAKAREAARAALEMAERGEDPAGDPAERRQAPGTVAAVVERYLELHVQRNRLRRAKDVERMFKSAVLPAWGNRRVRDITHADALDLIDDIAARAPVMANRVQSLLKRLFAFAVLRRYVDASPFAGMKPPAKERSRERVLTDDELGAMWRACDGLGWPFAHIIKLLVLTGARRSEVASMRWQDLDLDRGVWTKPAELTKSGRPQKLPLPQAAQDLIAGLPVIADQPWVFPARIGKGPASGFSGVKLKLDKLSGVSDWKFHDLRRTLATGLQELGVRLEVTENVLGHTGGSRQGVVGIYQRHEFLPEQRAALERWADHVLALAAGEAARKVVALRA